MPEIFVCTTTRMPSVLREQGKEKMLRRQEAADRFGKWRAARSCTSLQTHICLHTGIQTRIWSLHRKQPQLIVRGDGDTLTPCLANRKQDIQRCRIQGCAISRDYKLAYTVSHQIVHRDFSAFKQRVSRKPSEAVGSCRTGPPAGRRISSVF